MVVDPDGPECPCGQRGCWERYASGGGLARLARKAVEDGEARAVLALAGGDPDAIRGEHVAAAAAAGDAEACAVVAELGWWVGLGLANLANILDPEAFVVGGGLVEMGDLLLDPTRTAFATLLQGRAWRPAIPVVAAALGPRAGAIGAGCLGAELLQQNRQEQLREPGRPPVEPVEERRPPGSPAPGVRSLSVSGPRDPPISPVAPCAGSVRTMRLGLTLPQFRSDPEPALAVGPGGRRCRARRRVRVRPPVAARPAPAPGAALARAAGRGVGGDLVGVGGHARGSCRPRPRRRLRVLDAHPPPDRGRPPGRRPRHRRPRQPVREPGLRNRLPRPWPCAGPGWWRAAGR